MITQPDFHFPPKGANREYGRINETDIAQRADVPVAKIIDLADRFPMPVLAYRRLRKEERENFYQTIVDYLTIMEQTSGVRTKPENWRSEWRRVLERVQAKGPCIDTLRPDYFHYRTLRLDGEFVFTDDPLFEHHFYITILRALFEKFLSDHDRIIDLGCGTGTSLFVLNDLKSGRDLLGADWAPESQEIVNAIGATTGEDIRGINFNMQTLEGADELNFKEAAVITIHSMEQLGTTHHGILDLLLTQFPKLVFHLEPLEELYDKNSLFDQMAMTHHRQREYLSGYLTRIRQLAAEGRVELIVERRLNFGSTWHEAYSLLVWRPV